MINALPRAAVMKSTFNRHSCPGSSTRLSVSKTTVINVTAHAVRACCVLVTRHRRLRTFQTILAPPEQANASLPSAGSQGTVPTTLRIT
jgi:hypothetical protein